MAEPGFGSKPSGSRVTALNFQAMPYLKDAGEAPQFHQGWQLSPQIIENPPRAFDQGDPEGHRGATKLLPHSGDLHLGPFIPRASLSTSTSTACGLVKSLAFGVREAKFKAIL